jgi:S-adenosylmethionine:tRNA ribosyltransferase-isomerase
MDVSLFDFELPEDRIALRPEQPRDSARLMVIHADGQIEHRHIRDLPAYLEKGDCAVLNDTRVMAARLRGRRLRDYRPATVEVLLHRRLSPSRFSALAKPARKLVVGDMLDFGALRAEVFARGEAGNVEIEFALSGSALDSAIVAVGETPLPPYIAGRRKPDSRDDADYQTVFARELGSVAAPTAGLHFTEELLAELSAKGVRRETVTLHVGLGTFLPVTAAETSQHRMHAEHARLERDAADRLNRAKNGGKRVLAVGTTTLRTLESAVDREGWLHAFDGDTDIFITPGYRFHTTDALLTNFHLPRSTLFMLVCAFSGIEIMKNAYAEAIRGEYRFYSYGDACLLLRPR